MTEEKKPKRKYTRRPKVEPLAVYAVVVTIKRGRKTETVYGESAKVENGCLVLVSMDGPPPLVEKVRYIPLGGAEIEVCRRPTPTWGDNAYARLTAGETINANQMVYAAPPVIQQTDPYHPAGPRIVAGPLELARQRGALGPVVRPPAQGVIERNPEGVPVVTAGFMDGGPS